MIFVLYKILVYQYEIIYNKALNEYNNNNITLAWKIIEPYLDTSDPKLNYLYALLLADKTEYLKAKDNCIKAIKALPSFAKAHFLLGLINKQLNNMKEAIMVFQNTILINNNFIMAYFYLGQIYQETKNYEKALETFSKGRKVLNIFWTRNCY